MKILNIFFCCLFLVACSDEASDTKKNNSSTGEHVWNTQTDALEKAKTVEGMVLDSVEKTREQIDSEQ